MRSVLILKSRALYNFLGIQKLVSDPESHMTKEEMKRGGFKSTDANYQMKISCYDWKLRSSLTMMEGRGTENEPK